METSHWVERKTKVSSMSMCEKNGAVAQGTCESLPSLLCCSGRAWRGIPNVPQGMHNLCSDLSNNDKWSGRLCTHNVMQQAFQINPAERLRMLINLPFLWAVEKSGMRRGSISIVTAGSSDPPSKFRERRLRRQPTNESLDLKLGILKRFPLYVV